MYYTEILLSFAGSFAGRYFVSVRQDSVFERLPQAMGYTGETIPSCPQTEAWVFVCLGALFLLFVAAVLFSSSSLVWSVKLLLEIDDRTASFINPGAFYFLSRFLYVVFFIGVFSLFGYLYFRSADDGFLLSGYWLFLGTTTVFLALKLLLSHLLGFVFCLLCFLSVFSAYSATCISGLPAMASSCPNIGFSWGRRPYF